jgi:DNA-directed RNA polymerase specialized sigma24 family protein
MRKCGFPGEFEGGFFRLPVKTRQDLTGGAFSVSESDSWAKQTTSSACACWPCDHTTWLMRPFCSSRDASIQLAGDHVRTQAGRMLGREIADASGAVGQPLFTTTHWSVVLAAANEERPEAAAALERLCHTYWYPLYAYVRRRGYSPEDAQDHTQGFFLRLLRKHYLGQIDPGKGKFRSFLLAAINHFLADGWDHANAVKRGGGFTFLALDQDSAEQRLAGASTQHSPEQIFERCWALALLQEVLNRLREEASQAGRAAHFGELKVFLTGEKSPVSYAELAAKLGSGEAALRKEVQRLRHRYGELLREEIARTVADPLEIEEELRHLFRVLSV